MWVANSLSNQVANQVENKVALDESLSDVEVAVDGLNVVLSGPADLSDKALAAVGDLSMTRSVKYVSETKSPASDEVVVMPSTTLTEDSLQELNALFVLEPIQFSPRSSEITAESRKTLDSAFSLIEASESTSKFLIVGHTDSDGEAADNLWLSQSRANAVVTYLIEKGISQDRLTTEGRGETELKVEDNSAENKQLNRRIEWELS